MALAVKLGSSLSSLRTISSQSRSCLPSLPAVKNINSAPRPRRWVPEVGKCTAYLLLEAGFYEAPILRSPEVMVGGRGPLSSRRSPWGWAANGHKSLFGFLDSLILRAGRTAILPHYSIYRAISFQTDPAPPPCCLCRRSNSALRLSRPSLCSISSSSLNRQSSYAFF
jgi:hypothetical protein